MHPTPLCVFDGTHGGQPGVRLASPAVTTLQTDSTEILSAALNTDTEPVFTLPNHLQGQPHCHKLQLSMLSLLIEDPVAAT